jgi:hypothetical protein
MVRTLWESPEQHPLRRYCTLSGITELHLMNTLQDNGVVSDNAVSIDDVANWPRAMMWIDAYSRRERRLKTCEKKLAFPQKSKETPLSK